MLYAYYGTDTVKSRAKLAAVIEALHKKQPDAPMVKISVSDWSEEFLEEIVTAQPLFSSRQIVVLDHLLSDKTIGSVVEKRLKELSEHDSIFFCLDSKLLKAQTVKLEKYAEKVVVSDLKNVAPKSRWDASEVILYSLTDAVGARDRRASWTILQEATESGLSAEEIFWKLVWQMKHMLVACDKGATPENTGMSAYPLQKARTMLKNFSHGELCQKFRDLLTLYHDARRGVCDLPTGVELFVLTL